MRFLDPTPFRFSLKASIPGLIVAAAAAAGMVACTHAAPVPDAQPAQKQAEVEKPAAPEQPATPSDQFKAQGQAELDSALEKLRGVSVFFQFDESTLTKDAQEKLALVADVLARHQELDVKIEGNCDERGSSQYNLALGQRRADEVKRYVVALGVKTAQIKAISLGSERPKDPGHDEDAWKQNRRADVNTGK